MAKATVVVAASYVTDLPLKPRRDTDYWRGRATKLTSACIIKRISGKDLKRRGSSWCKRNETIPAVHHRALTSMPLDNCSSRLHTAKAHKPCHMGPRCAVFDGRSLADGNQLKLKCSHQSSLSSSFLAAQRSEARRMLWASLSVCLSVCLLHSRVTRKRF